MRYLLNFFSVLICILGLLVVSGLITLMYFIVGSILKVIISYVLVVALIYAILLFKTLITTGFKFTKNGKS
jgi:hypothetical protein